MKDKIIINGQKYRRVKDKKNNETEYYEIPDNINISYKGNILFNNQKQLLHYCDGNYEVLSYYRPVTDCSQNFVLVPVEREDLESENVAYCSNIEKPDFSVLYRYCLILNNEEHVYIDKKNTVVSTFRFNYWFKVVPRTEVEQ